MTTDDRPVAQEAIWKQLRTVEPSVGARERVRTGVERRLARSRPWLWIALPIAVTVAAAVALVVSVRSGGDSTGPTVVAASGVTQGDRAVAAGEPLAPGAVDVGATGSLRVSLLQAAVAVAGPARVALANDAVELFAGRVEIEGSAEIRGPTCTARVRGKSVAELDRARLVVTVIAGSAEIVPPQQDCEVVDLLRAASTMPKEPVGVAASTPPTAAVAASMPSKAAVAADTPSTSPPPQVATAAPSKAAVAADTPLTNPPPQVATAAPSMEPPVAVAAEMPSNQPPVKVAAAKVEPARVEPAKVEPARVEPARVEPAKVGHAKVEPAKIEPAKVEPAKVEPEKVEPAKVGPVKVEPAKVGSGKLEPAKVEPAMVERVQPPAPATTDELPAQMAAYREAHGLRERDPAAALSKLRELVKRWPRAAIRHEVDLAVIDALVRLGKSGEAKKAARSFVRDYPTSARANDIRAIAEAP
jgi:hypothetical protein